MSCPLSAAPLTVAPAFLLSWTSVMLSRCLSSKLSCVFLVSTRQTNLSCAQDSSCFGGMLTSAMLTFTQSPYHLRALPWLCLPAKSSPYSSCFGTLDSCIRMTCPVYRSWVFKIMASMLADTALSERPAAIFMKTESACSKQPKTYLKEVTFDLALIFFFIGRA